MVFVRQDLQELASKQGGREPLSSFDRFAVLGGVLWLVFLAAQPGNPWDEGEHAHVAWLIGHEGLTPLRDFFQHHTPVLWNLLALYYRAGLDGPWVVLFGRGLVVVCGAIVCFGLVRATEDLEGRKQVLGPALFALLTLAIPELFIIRPETVAAALTSMSLYLWSRRDAGLLQQSSAGALYGIAVLASPRFLLCAPLICCVFPGDSMRAVLKSSLAAIAAGSSAVALWLAASGFSLSDLVFCLRFSAHLQMVGRTDHGISPAVLSGVAITGICAGIGMLASAPGTLRLRGLGIHASTALSFAISWVSAREFPYPQAFAAFFFSLAFGTSYSGAFFKPRPSVKRVFLLTSLAAAAFFSYRAVFRSPLFPLLPGLHARADLRSLVPAGEAVLMFSVTHPITVRDTSYYGAPLFDSRDRLCRALATYEGKKPAPPCDFLEDLRRKPALTSPWILRGIGYGAEREAVRFLSEDYGPLPGQIESNWPAYFHGTLIRTNLVTERDKR